MSNADQFSFLYCGDGQRYILAILMPEDSESHRG